MQFEEALSKLRSIGQQHLLNSWDSLNQDQRLHLLEQIQAVNIEQLTHQQTQLNIPSLQGPFEPFTDATWRGNKADLERGLKLLSQGKAACLLVAGGQGTRLGFDGPKGLFPITPLTHKSLFQLFAEKTLAASKQAGIALSLAIMTSPLNHQETLAFFAEHDNFGLASDQLDFFSQGMLPFLDSSGHLVLNEEGTLAMGPDGNGSSLQGLIQSGILAKWRQKGVELFNFVLVDNPLADPYDAELIGFHARHDSEVTVKCIQRLHPDEKVGVLLKVSGKLHVVEYSELPENERTIRLPEGTLKHSYANISLFCFSLRFIEKLEAEKAFDSMPLHPALKPVSAQVKAWKFERFIFDVLPLAESVRALLYPREECFAPLKNAEGLDSPATVRKVLEEREKAIYKQVTGLEPPEGPFELNQEFYYRP